MTGMSNQTDLTMVKNNNDTTAALLVNKTNNSDIKSSEWNCRLYSTYHSRNIEKKKKE